MQFSAIMEQVNNSMLMPYQFSRTCVRGLGRSGFFFFIVLMAFVFGESPAIYLATGVDFPTEAERAYQLERSSDMVEWEAIGDPAIGGEAVEDCFPLQKDERFFYRLRELKDQWVLVWQDDFEGSEIDHTKWQHEVNANGGGNNELQYYTDEPENSFVEDGKLVIETRKESYGGLEGSREYTSARLNTKFLGSWTYGKIEVRARLPVGRGLWPAIWMLPVEDEYGGWASSGEIDIVEAIGHEPTKIHGTIHHGGSWPHNISTGDERELDTGTVSDAFHTYAVEWEEGEIRWFLDGEVYQALTAWESSGAAFPAPFNQPFYLILNVAVGGTWPGDPDETTPFPVRMEVEGVKVYQWID